MIDRLGFRAVPGTALARLPYSKRASSPSVHKRGETVCGRRMLHVRNPFRNRGCHTDWDQLIPGLSDVADVLKPDLRGFLSVSRRANCVAARHFLLTGASSSWNTDIAITTSSPADLIDWAVFEVHQDQMSAGLGARSGPPRRQEARTENHCGVNRAQNRDPLGVATLYPARFRAPPRRRFRPRADP